MYKLQELAFSGQFAAELLGEMREYEQSESMAVRTLEIAEKHNFSAIVSNCHLFMGRARAQLGRPTEGIALIRQGLASLLEMGPAVGAPVYMSVLAQVQRRAGLLIEALETIEGALRASAEVSLYRPESLRISGELRLENREVELAEAQFREGLALARTRGTKAWELRATMSLARMLVSTGRGNEASVMLAEIYNWFTEGFDTADLKEAKALLDELAA
jgi:predicted ATPase